MGLRIAASSPDGFIEALELVDYGTFGIGVQWHPEHMAAYNRQQQKLFDVFVKKHGALLGMQCATLFV